MPGLQISFPSNSANAAAPGSITIPNIRGATAYETASLIDGHAISVGQYGDNVTTFLNSFLFSEAEVIKGPGRRLSTGKQCHRRHNQLPHERSNANARRTIFRGSR